MTQCYDIIPVEPSSKLLVYKLLDQMIEELYDAGVDVSYFPERAELVQETYARLIAELIE